ncbi:CPBP family intramembrane glutamic endopeptidase [Pelagibacterium sp. H642]|uniref:CPBP family intramembrane glutamic endopeptidase n=1 Tax=Pelagibacterium sp. H642 TaxID=1881069 RepID=UPI002816249A|nr:CPBP family intramembrane glutamic endopeptidase [Pelagibacterium sp. H642]WMT90079.1 CPBP family intramembrane metalloprotease [Pelagibacterium sp. H642]
MIASAYVRVGIVWVTMIAIWLLLSALRDIIWGTGPAGYSLGGHVTSAILATLLAVPMVVMARLVLDGKSVASLGLDLSPTAFRNFIVGALAFLLPSALGFLIVLSTGWASITPTAPIGEIALFVPLLITLVFLYEALPEELAFRGYIQVNLQARLGYWGAIFAQAALFALWGAALWTVGTGAPALDRLVLFFFIALVLGMVSGATGSVWTAIGLHVAFQTVAQLLLNAERGHFAVEGADMLQLIALGVVPFSLALMVVDALNRPARSQAEVR